MYLNHAKAFVCILITVYHALSFSSKFQSENFIRSHEFFGNMFFYGRVPFFFVLAGYLFHHSYTRSGNMTDTVFKRVKNLSPPYLFWNIVMMAMILISLKLGYSDGEKKFFSFSEIIKITIGIGSHPANAPLWFVRDLIILFLVSPFLMRLRAFFPYFSVIAILISLNYQDPNFFKISSLVFYITGFYLYQFTQPRELEARIGAIRNSSIYIFLSVMFCLAFLNQSHLMPLKIGIVGPFLGVTMITAIGELLARNSGFISRASLAVSESSFLIYVSHYPILNVFSSASKYFKSYNEFVIQHPIFNIFMWIIYAVIIIAGTIVIHKFIKLKFPKYLILLTGSR